jgi:hypothetical protein
MRDDAETTGIYGEPDIILFGPDEPARERAPRRRRQAAETIRKLFEIRFVQPGLLLLVAGIAVLALQLSGHRGAPDPPTLDSPAAPPSGANMESTGAARLVAAHTARPGERLTVLAYRDARLCGPAELRIDGAPVWHQLDRRIGPVGSGLTEMFLTLEVPRSISPGQHEIQLYGPVRAVWGSICGDAPERQGRLATSRIIIK